MSHHVTTGNCSENYIPVRYISKDQLYKEFNKFLEKMGVRFGSTNYDMTHEICSLNFEKHF